MTTQMQTFLLELAKLLKKHDVEIEALEETRNYATWCDGIEFTAWSRYDDAGNQLRDTCRVKTSRTPDPTELLSLANDKTREPTST